MVQSRAESADAYEAEVDAARRPSVARLRELARTRLPGFAEGMRYGMIYYAHPDGRGFALAVQARHLAFYYGPEILGKHAKELIGKDAGKGCLRFPSAASVDWSLIDRLLKDVGAPGGG